VIEACIEGGATCSAGGAHGLAQHGQAQEECINWQCRRCAWTGVRGRSVQSTLTLKNTHTSAPPPATQPTTQPTATLVPTSTHARTHAHTHMNAHTHTHAHTHVCTRTHLEPGGHNLGQRGRRPRLFFHLGRLVIRQLHQLRADGTAVHGGAHAGACMGGAAVRAGAAVQEGMKVRMGACAAVHGGCAPGCGWA